MIKERRVSRGGKANALFVLETQRIKIIVQQLELTSKRSGPQKN